ncbi:MAG: zinc ribbon-containing protein [Gammaproteobacteria bacterium]|nr:zinc ribbon-containing protein [Gammaproteobacteria bacterium]MDH5694779.1 zinc ribbon-containing protein [Gammaproteobacteria bacterium]
MNDIVKIDKKKLSAAYHKFLDLTEKALEDFTAKAEPVVEKAFDQAEAGLHALGELTKDEAAIMKLAVKKDLASAARALKEDGRAIADWLRLDLLIVEDRVRDQLSHLTDHTAEELHHLEEMATELGEWHTGEIVGHGVLVCDACGQTVHFENPGHVPPCPKCKGSKFHRNKSD